MRRFAVEHINIPVGRRGGGAKEETQVRLVARRVSCVARKTPGGFETGFNFPKGDPLVPVESRNSRTIGSTGEETENVTLRECGECGMLNKQGDGKNKDGGQGRRERDRTRCRTGSSP